MDDIKAEVEQPEVTVSGLLQDATMGEENAKALLYKQIGVKEFLAQLDKEGYELVKKDQDEK